MLTTLHFYPYFYCQWNNAEISFSFWFKTHEVSLAPMVIRVLSFEVAFELCPEFPVVACRACRGQCHGLPVCVFTSVSKPLTSVLIPSTLHFLTTSQAPVHLNGYKAIHTVQEGGK